MTPASRGAPPPRGQEPPRVSPPRAWRATLARLLPPGEADAILGDLEEGFHARVADRSPVAARRWYRREAVGYAVRLGPARLLTFLMTPFRSQMLRHLHSAARRLLRDPAFTLVVATTLALGIGANATIFSVVDAVLFRPLPVDAPERLVELYGSSARDADAGGMFQGFLPVSYPDFEDVRDAAASVEGMFVHSMWPVSITAGQEAERIDGLYVSASYFDLLGVRPHLGRVFRPDEDRQPGADAVVVLQHGYWERRFASDPSVIGRTVTINARPMEIVGVAAPGFRGTNATLLPDVFVPVSMIGDVPPWGPLSANRGMRFFYLGARIAPGRTLANVRAEMDALSARLAEAHPDVNANRGLQVLPLQEARVGASQAATLGRTGAVLLAMAGLMLLIASMNVANLLLARALSRGTEMAIRTSLGATRGHLVGQMLAESGLLFALGAGLGVGAAVAVLGALDGIQPPAFGGGTLDVGLDHRVLAFTGAATLLAALLFGVGPSVRAAHAPAASGLRAVRGGRSARGRVVREGLVLGQVALSVVALAGAGVFLRSLEALRTVDPGFEVEGLAMMSVDLAAQGIGEDGGRAFYRRMIETADALPGVESAAVGGFRPLTPGPIRRATRSDQDRTDASLGHFVRVEPVTDGWFATLGVEIEAGRPLEPADRAGSRRVAVANRRLAELLWPGEDAVGRYLDITLVDESIEVVGVAAATRTVSLSEDAQPVLYVPLEQNHPPAAVLFARLRAGASLEEVRRAVQALDPTLPVFDAVPAEALVADAVWTARVTARVLGLFGLLGLVLAGVGVYGVVSHSVRERTREMGLRIALGAGRGRVLSTAVGRVLVVTGIGAFVGVAVAWVSLDAFSAILFQVEATDPATLAPVALGLLGVAALAAWVPARRATRVDPMVVLRGE